jgi:NAD(P) transhydrogenase subunit alpha
MKVAVLHDRLDGETRVALTPASIARLVKKRVEIVVESGAGVASGFADDAYTAAGATIAPSADQAMAEAHVVAMVRVGAAAPGVEMPRFRSDQVVIAHADPFTSREAIEPLASTGATLLALELVPRTTKAQSMDTLSSQATVAGYRSVLLAATHLPKLMPMMMTAAGTIQPAHVFVIGAGVAGLQAIATAKRLGAVVHAFDVRPAVKEQVQSLGAKFVEFDVGGAEGAGGYAQELTPEQQEKQQSMMADVIASSDVVITTALVPGKPAPKLITRAAVERMARGSVIVDLASEKGGNCEVTVPGRVHDHHGVTIVGHTNLPAHAPTSASGLLSGNVANLLMHLLDKEGRLTMSETDEIVGPMTVCRGGRIVHPRVREVLGIRDAEATR